MPDPILILAPHTDDGELGCGGSIARFIDEGSTVYYIAFSICEDSVPEGYPKDILLHEVRKGVKTLGIKSSNLIVKKYPVRRFNEFRQEILDDMIQLKKKINPQLILMPSSYDVHQDHQVIHQEGLRAFKDSSILGYEFIWNNYKFKTGSFVRISEENLQKKINALRQYESQKNRFYNSDEAMRGLATYRGLQINMKFAEAFEVIRWIIK